MIPQPADDEGCATIKRWKLASNFVSFIGGAPSKTPLAVPLMLSSPTSSLFASAPCIRHFGCPLNYINSRSAAVESYLMYGVEKAFNE